MNGVMSWLIRRDPGKIRFTGIVMSMFEEVDPVRDDEVGARTARLLPGVGGDSECYKYLCCLFSADHLPTAVITGAVIMSSIMV